MLLLYKDSTDLSVNLCYAKLSNPYAANNIEIYILVDL